MCHLLFVFLSPTQSNFRSWELVRYSVCNHFRKARAQSLRGIAPVSHLPQCMSPARNKAAIVNSPNFTAACRNPVLLFSCSSTSTLCWDQSGLSRPQKNLRLTLRRLSAPGLTLPGSLAFRCLRHAICFHLSNRSIHHKRKC